MRIAVAGGTGWVGRPAGAAGRGTARRAGCRARRAAGAEDAGGDPAGGEGAGPPRKLVLGMPWPSAAGLAMATGGLLPTGAGPRGTIRFDQWLAGQARAGAAR